MAFTIALFDPETIQKTADTLKTIGHPLRLRMIEYLDAYKELSVGQLQELLKIGQSVVSQQLALLRNKGIVKSRRDGTTVFYSVSNKKVISLIQCLAEDNDLLTPAILDQNH